MKHIVFEGPDGVGKTTVVQQVAAALRDAGGRPVASREPGGPPQAEKIRSLQLKDPDFADASDDVRALLMAGGCVSNAAFATQMHEKGATHYLLDRWAPISSRAFQQDSEIVDWVRVVQNLPVKPNLVIYLRAPWETIVARHAARNEGKDNIDTGDMAVGRSRWEAYEHLLNTMNDEGVHTYASIVHLGYGIPTVTVNADAPIEDVVQACLNEIQKLVTSIKL